MLVEVLGREAGGVEAGLGRVEPELGAGGGERQRDSRGGAGEAAQENGRTAATSMIISANSPDRYVMEYL